MSRHHWMYFGCQCSSARCSRLLLDRLTLFGIFSAEIMVCSHWQPEKSLRVLRSLRLLFSSRALPIELRPPLLAVRLERALLADGIRALEDPVLPRGEPAEDLRLHRLRTGKTEVRFESGHRVRRERRA